MEPHTLGIGQCALLFGRDHVPAPGLDELAEFRSCGQVRLKLVQPDIVPFRFRTRAAKQPLMFQNGSVANR